MKYYLFQALDDQAEEELIRHGLQDLYRIEEGETIFIGGRCKKKPSSLKHSELIEEKESTIDWEEQWSLFAEGFAEGKAHIDLAKFGGTSTLLLLPGPGFGDLSHPTTYLMLEMMQSHIRGQAVLDIGTGSGILALAALLLGASSAIGIDIDDQALLHARTNAEANHLKARFQKTLPRHTPPSIVLINMIFPEQKQALRRIERYNKLAKLWIVSGILAEQKEEYLEQTRTWGWKIQEEHQKGEWLGWVFTQ